MGLRWEALYADRARGMKASDIREAFRLSEEKGVISFAGGFPCPDAFPAREVAAIAAQVAAADGARALQYGPTQGLRELRAALADRMSAGGMAVLPEEVLVTHGSQQALDLIGKVFLNPGDRIVVELPGYVGGLGAFQAYQASFAGIPLDEEGLQVGILAERLTALRRAGQPLPKLAYVVPNYQNPSGVTLSEERRRWLLALAEEFAFAVIEDDPYGQLGFEGDSPPSLRALDGQGGHVIHLGSFSKVFLPGLRLGWVVAPEPLIQKLTIAKQATDLCTQSLGQLIALEALRKGLIGPGFEPLRDLYRARRDAMLWALQEYFPPEVTWTRPKGGFFIWVTLPPHLDAKLLLPRVVEEEQVAYVSGSAFFADGRGQNTIRLAYSQVSVPVIEEGIRRLGRFFSRVLAETPALS